MLHFPSSSSVLNARPRKFLAALNQTYHSTNEHTLACLQQMGAAPDAADNCCGTGIVGKRPGQTCAPLDGSGLSLRD